MHALALARSAQSRYGTTQTLVDLEEAIELYSNVIDTCPPDHPERIKCLIELVVNLLDHFTRINAVQDLDKAAGHCHEALTLCPLGHKDHFTVVNNITLVKAYLFHARGDITNLSESISFSRELLGAYPPGHDRHNGVLVNLATSLCTHFDHTHDVRDIEEAVQIYRDVLPSRSENSIPNRFTCLTKLATALQSQFEACQRLDYLDEAIQYWREVVEKSWSPPVLSSLLDSHTSLADALYRRFDEVSHIPDLEEAIALHHFILSLRRDFNKAEDPSLHSLGRCLIRRFVHTSNLNDLEQAITCHRLELHCRPAGNDSRASTLEALASALCYHYDIHGTQDSLDEAIDLYNQALQSSLCGRHDNLRVLCLSGLGDALHRRFDEVTSSTQDIESSIANHRRALELYGPHGRHCYKFLVRLAAALLSRADHSGLEEDIHELVSLDCRVIEQCPPGSVDRAIALGNRGNGLCTRYQQFGHMEDLESAADNLREAVDALPALHTVRVKVVVTLDNHPSHTDARKPVTRE